MHSPERIIQDTRLLYLFCYSRDVIPLFQTWWHWCIPENSANNIQYKANNWSLTRPQNWVHSVFIYAENVNTWFHDWDALLLVMEDDLHWSPLINKSYEKRVTSNLVRISVISSRSVLLVEDTSVLGENHRPAASLKSKFANLICTYNCNKCKDLIKWII